MTDTLTTRPAPVSRVWSGGEIVAENVEGDDLADVLNLHAGAEAWWVLPRQPSRPSLQLHQAARALELDDLAIADLIADDRRAKFEQLGSARLVTTNAVTVDRQAVELTVHPISMLVTDRAFICLVDAISAQDELPGGLDPVRLLVQSHQQLASGGAELAMQLVVGAVVDTYAAAVGWLEDCSDDLADLLFAQRPLGTSEQLRALKLRTALSQLRRLTEPMREVLDKLADPTDPGPACRRWTLLGEQHRRVATAANTLRETLASILDTSLALAGLRMNEGMKRVTGWAAIIAVPTLITGIAVQNVSFTRDGTAAGFWVSLALIMVSSAVLYLWFRRRGWI